MSDSDAGISTAFYQYLTLHVKILSHLGSPLQFFLILGTEIPPPHTNITRWQDLSSQNFVSSIIHLSTATST